MNILSIIRIRSKDRLISDISVQWGQGGGNRKKVVREMVTNFFF